MSTLILDVRVSLGRSIDYALQDAFELSLRMQVTVRFVFNGVAINVDGSKPIEKLKEFYHKKLREPNE